MPNMRISFEVTNRCNLKCRHCMRRRDFPVYDLDFEFFDNLLEQARGYGIGIATLTGGEPFLHPDWQKLVSRLVERDFKFSLVTNGILLPKASGFLAQPPIRSHLRHVSVSFEGTTPDVHDTIRGQGNFKRAMKGILAARSRNIPLSLKFTIMRPNFGQIEDAVIMASHLGMQGVEFAHLHPTPDNIEAGLMLSPGEWRDAESTVGRIAEAVKIKVSVCAGHYDPNFFSMCGHLAMNEMYIDPRGYLAVCCMLPGIRGMDPDAPEKDIAADLHEVSLAEAHDRLVNIISDYHHYRIEKIRGGAMTALENYQCMACAKYFDKLDWLRKYPENSWTRLLEGKEE